jgi:hypothetical protein
MMVWFILGTPQEFARADSLPRSGEIHVHIGVMENWRRAVKSMRRLVRVSPKPCETGGWTIAAPLERIRHSRLGRTKPKVPDRRRVHGINQSGEFQCKAGDGF